MQLDRDVCYAALTARDRRFDGRFYTCVASTGIYCRPICPVPPPKLENCSFLPSAAAAHAAGYRPCLRCRPEVAPGLAGWRGTANTVSRALALIADGALDTDDVDALGDRLGVGSRHLRRLFAQHVGASPTAVVQAHRILLAKRLISDSTLPMTDVALAAGFGSVRRFNSVIRQTYSRAPRELRQAGMANGLDDSGAIRLRLPYTPPYDWPAILAFLGQRAIPGVEMTTADAYRRTIAIGDAVGTIAVSIDRRKHQLSATITLSRVHALASVVTRLRRLFDLDADTTAIETHLGRDPRLASTVAARPGLRVPGAWDAFELAVRAILGQQVSVAGARTLAARLTEIFGRATPEPADGLSRLFPQPAALKDADLAIIGIPQARAKAIGALARAVVDDRDLLQPFGTLEETEARLCALPGIGPWTAQYIAMRALAAPDAFPTGDIGLLRALGVDGTRPTTPELAEIAERWRPWRAYAVLHLWMKDASKNP